MADITLISKEQARVGFEFIYQGAAPVCRTCPYRHACLTLDAGHRYRVAKVRPVEHPCALQEVSANVVEVEPIPRSVVVDARSAIIGSSVDVARYACSRLDCPNWDICAGPSLPAKQRFRVEGAQSSLAECRIGRTLKQVDVV